MPASKDADDILIPFPGSTGEGVRLRPESFQWQYARSGGPGGQNVNKVATKALLRWNPNSIDLPADARHRLLHLASTYLTAEGDLLIVSQRHRSQKMNGDDCVEKLVHLIQRALIRPVPRKKTRPTKGSKERRLHAKKHASKRRAERRISGGE
jgi:ribosome-associated protein